MIRSSKAFKEFVVKRCEEILKENNEYNKLLKQSNEIIKDLMSELSEENKETFLKYELINAKMQSLIETSIYVIALSDAKQIF